MLSECMRAMQNSSTRRLTSKPGGFKNGMAVQLSASVIWPTLKVDESYETWNENGDVTSQAQNVIRKNNSRQSISLDETDGRQTDGTQDAHRQF